MRLRRSSWLVAALTLVACGGGGPAAEAPSTDAAAEALSPDEQAWEDIRAYYAEHYNMGHPDMVAALYTEDAWRLPAAGQLQEGRAEIEADLAAPMAASPQVEITGVENLIFSDIGVGIGTYEVSSTPPDGEPVSYGGSYLNLMQKVDGEWQIAGSILNYDSARPEGWTWAPAETDIPSDEGTMGEAIGQFVTHWNAGQPDMVAESYAEDVVLSLSNSGWTRGRAAAGATLAARIPEGSQLTVHDVATISLAEGWALDGGWYQIDDAEGTVLQMGAYVHVMREQADGSWKIQWGLTNAQPPAM